MERERIFWGVWGLTTVGLAGLLGVGEHDFGTPGTAVALLFLLICTFSLIKWLPRPTLDGVPGPAQTRRGRFVVLILFVTVFLLPLRRLVGPPLLFLLPPLGLLVIVGLRPQVSRVEGVYAVGLAFVAALAGLGAGWIEAFSLPAWAALQVALVLPGLLGGWAILRRTGLWEGGVGRSTFLFEGWRQAIRTFIWGAFLSLPWALGLVVLGSANEDTWVTDWWRPVAAIQPAISEEAWGRVLLVPLLYLLFRRVARPAPALTASAVIMAYWFAQLHTDGGLGDLVSVLLIGTIYALPTTYVWLRVGLEAAIGYHFLLDFVRFMAAYILVTN